MKKDESTLNRMNRRAGFSILEPLLAVSLISFLVLGIVAALVYGRATTVDAAARGKALLLADEGIEAVRSIRAGGFSMLEEGTYGLSAAGPTWSLVPGSDTIGEFERTIEITDTEDSSKQITSSVEWTGEYGQSSVTVETRLYDWQII